MNEMTKRAGAVPMETKANLLRSATAEFLKCGYEEASLRRICSEAGVTTGALYFFFNDKEDLFIGVISPVTDKISELIREHFEKELHEPQMSRNSEAEEAEDFRTVHEIISIYYQFKDATDILLENRDHPVVVAFFDRLIDMIDQQTVALLRHLFPEEPQEEILNEYTIHWFSHLQVDAVTDIIKHDLTQEEADRQLRIMIRFLRGGFYSLLS